MTRPPDGIEVGTPADWVELDLGRMGEPDVAEALIDRRLDDVPALAEHRDDLVGIALRTSEQAARAGVTFAAVLADERDGSPMLASLVMTVFGPSETQAAGAAEGAAEASAAPVVTPVDLASGPAGREEALHRIPLDGTSGELAILAVRYLIPIPGTDAAQVLSFSTPTVGHRGELVPAFHAIADSVRFRWD